jgi:pantoate--beta-alanine ligase
VTPIFSLFNIVFFNTAQPQFAVFGKKDFQQLAIIRHLAKILYPTMEIIGCPIIRETDGLAMSSRNTLLNKEEREIASLVPKLMLEAKKIVKEKNITAAKLFVEEETKKIALMKLDYFEICDAETLEEISEINSEKKAIALIALFVGKIRLIDNLQLG